MKEEFYEICLGAYEYLIKVVEYVKLVWVLLYTFISYILFPNESYIPPTLSLLGALVMDVFTKYYAISKQNGGFKHAVKTRKITSNSFWKGTKKKLVSMLVIMICCGLLIRFTPFLPEIAVTVTIVCYGFMFLREIQSIAENMIDAGHDDMVWFLNLLKRKKKQFIDENGIDEQPTEEINKQEE
ncbi:phage holin family protein [Paenibacillus medicaginis]|uniref:Phage holin family protein n=1 Tax=Paenibacillus medicaginis TaxID=1470560 RepID=A0ABV5BV17_9BACL